MRPTSSKDLTARWWLTAGVLLFLWEFTGRLFQIRASLLPTPSRILLEMWKEMPRLLEHGMVTTSAILAGLLIAIPAGIATGVLIHTLPPVQRTLMPWILLSRRVPKVAVAPVLLVWFGFGVTSKILVAALLAFFPVALAVVFGLRSVPPEMVDLARCMGAGRRSVLVKFLMPASLPRLFTGLKSATTLSVAGVTVGEFVGGDRGLGYLLLFANSNLNTSLLLSALTMLLLIGSLLYSIIAFLERAWTPWSKRDPCEGELGSP